MFIDIPPVFVAGCVWTATSKFWSMFSFIFPRIAQTKDRQRTQKERMLIIQQFNTLSMAVGSQQLNNLLSKGEYVARCLHDVLWSREKFNRF